MTDAIDDARNRWLGCAKVRAAAMRWALSLSDDDERPMVLVAEDEAEARFDKAMAEEAAAWEFGEE